jgi:UDP-glucose 4-epimerase
MFIAVVLLSRTDVKKVVYASSSSVYGDSQILPKKEDMLPNPLSPYAVSKLAGENYCRVFSSIYGLKAIVLRYFNVFGSRQDPTSQYSAAIPKFITMMLKGEQPTIYGDGTQSRDFTYVANVVHANLLCCNVDIPFGIFNVAYGKTITVIDLEE